VVKKAVETILDGKLWSIVLAVASAFAWLWILEQDKKNDTLEDKLVIVEREYVKKDYLSFFDKRLERIENKIDALDTKTNLRLKGVR